jgi:hypothetical protein
VVYAIHVFADGGGGWSGCGAPGRMVVFWVGTQPMGHSAVWNNSRVQELTLPPRAEESVYLPLIARQR